MLMGFHTEARAGPWLPRQSGPGDQGQSADMAVLKRSAITEQGRIPTQ